MPGRSLNRLTARTVAAAGPGIYEDGGGLRLVVDKHGKRFSIRLSINGRRVHKGLGSVRSVSLAEARIKAAEFRSGARDGRDLAAELKAGQRVGKTFQDAFEAFFELKVTTLSNIKHAAQWRSTMKTYVFPFIGRRPVADIGAGEILLVLRPIWQSKPETAARVLQRMDAVFKSAIVLGHRERASPTLGVAQLLGPQLRPAGNHPAVPYLQVPGLVAKLHCHRGLSPITKLALELLLLTACRSGEVRGARWEEFDRAQNTWIIPASRLKTRRRRHQPHVIPLGPRAISILEEVFAFRSDSGLVFPGVMPGRPLSENTFGKALVSLGFKNVTAHGFRSSFKDWCAESQVRDEVSEAALGHLVAGKVRAAYLRTQFLRERADLALRWEAFLASAGREA